MSLVGPRPLQLRDSDKLQSLDFEGYANRLRVMPGLTGPWQVGGRKDVDYAHMVKLDVDYVKNWSLSKDLWIIFRTFLVVLGGHGATELGLRLSLLLGTARTRAAVIWSVAQRRFDPATMAFRDSRKAGQEFENLLPAGFPLLLKSHHALVEPDYHIAI